MEQRYEMRVADAMTRGCQCVGAAESVATVAALMAQGDIGMVPICGADARLHGVITDRDIVVRIVAEGLNPSLTPAGHLATDDVVWVYERDSIDKAMSRMEEQQVRRLLVLDENKQLTGVLTMHDMARYLEDDDLGELEAFIARDEEPVPLSRRLPSMRVGR